MGFIDIDKLYPVESFKLFSSDHFTDTYWLAEPVTG